jgi:hypothetical protein
MAAIDQIPRVFIQAAFGPIKPIRQALPLQGIALAAVAFFQIPPEPGDEMQQSFQGRTIGGVRLGLRHELTRGRGFWN